ncbi:MAG: hypothetical protein ACTHJ8_00630 [Mucilaginibacter sp.]
MKTLFDNDEALQAGFPGGDDDDDLDPATEPDTSAAGDELHPEGNNKDEDDEYIDVDEGEDEDLDEEDAINSDEDAYEAEETAENEDELHNDQDLNENEELQAEGAPEPTERSAEKGMVNGPANDTVSQPGKE